MAAYLLNLLFVINRFDGRVEAKFHLNVTRDANPIKFVFLPRKYYRISDYVLEFPSDVYFHIHEIRQAQMSLSHMLVTCGGHLSILSNAEKKFSRTDRDAAAS